MFPFSSWKATASARRRREVAVGAGLLCEVDESLGVPARHDRTSIAERPIDTRVHLRSPAGNRQHS
jgi:hypothetical protein